MKKALLSIALVAAGCGLASAQHAGQAGVGINVGVAPIIEGNGSPTNFLLGGRVQYSFTDDIRGHLDFNGGFADKNISTFDATANVDYVIPLQSGFYLYPTAGLGYGNVHFSAFGFTANDSKFVFNVGIGAEYEFSRNFAASLEFKYRYMKDYQALPVALNFSYKF